MMLRNLGNRLITALFLLGCASIPVSVNAQLAYFTSAHLCDQYAASAQGRFIRDRDGRIYNIAEDRTITVSCPIFFDVYTTTIDVIVRPVNLNQSGNQTISCDLKIYDLGDFQVRNVRRSEVYPYRASNDLLFQGIGIGQPGNRVDLICKLPPQTAIGLIGAESY